MIAKYHQIVEVKITEENANGKNVNVNFLQQPQLQSYNVKGQKVYIEGIEAYHNEALLFSPLSAGVNVASPWDLKNATLTFMEGNSALRASIPLSRLSYAYPNAVSFAPAASEQIQWKELYEIDWTKCYLTVLSIPPLVPFSYVFGVYYDYTQAIF